MAMVGDETRHYRAHCLIVPYPIQSHINPMLQFAKRLRQHRTKITLLLSNYFAKTTDLPSSAAFPVDVETFSDGYDDGVPLGTDYNTAATRLHQVGPPTLRAAIVRAQAANPGCPVDCLVYDSFLYWAPDAAKEFGLTAAAFFTQPCGVNRIYHAISTGDLTLPLPPGKKIVIPGLPALETRGMPSFISRCGSYPTIFKSAIEQFHCLEKADWIFFNTFYKLEEEVIDYMAKFLPVKTIGPTIPSMYLDNLLPDDTHYHFSAYTAASCLEWLNQRWRGSVIYVSFGSLAQLSKAQMEELAWSLKQSNKHFLWVVRSPEQSKLPEGFVKETLEKGLIVPWCNQLEVLAHRAIGCFVTHCGWNSTLEAVSLGVPMVAVPQRSDQPTNAKLVADVWKVGIRATPGSNGVVGRETIEWCVKQVMDGEGGKEMRRNADTWKDLATSAMYNGGTSDRNIQDFVRSAFGSVPC